MDFGYIPKSDGTIESLRTGEQLEEAIRTLQVRSFFCLCVYRKLGKYAFWLITLLPKDLHFLEPIQESTSF